MSYDPCEIVFDRLEAHGCNPRGPTHKFVALCPAHDDRSPSLSVREGADLRCLVHCQVGCEPEEIIRLLGLCWSDLFPNGHYKAPAWRQPRVITDRPIRSVLIALDLVGIRWRHTAAERMFIADRAPSTAPGRCGCTTRSRPSACPAGRPVATGSRSSQRSSSS